LGPRALAQDIKTICQQINRLNDQVRDNQLTKTVAKNKFKELINGLDKFTKPPTTDLSWSFPLQGYKANAIGGAHGNGYSDKGYSYFDGNKHAAHPAHYIFINDRNQDVLDDKTSQPVNVLALADGIVIACCNEWNEHSVLRGGRYIWIYHPQLHIISYYAHNREIIIAPGDEVKQGQKIAEVGRTGFNAFKKRSPTHLHFGTYKLIDGLPVPFNCYSELLKAKTQ
jgi:murein DD-endopeptidase MepM/ murein hydrolase activator NlpD